MLIIKMCEIYTFQITASGDYEFCLKGVYDDKFVLRIMGKQQQTADALIKIKNNASLQWEV